jgi:hypothetical protein
MIGSRAPIVRSAAVMPKRTPIHPVLRSGHANLPWTRRRRLQVRRADPAQTASSQMPLAKPVADVPDSGLQRRLAVSTATLRSDCLAS